METIVTLSTKFLNEFGSHEHDNNLLKLLDAGSNYLIQWHNGISKYITKTNNRFEHLHGLLAEIPNSSDEESLLHHHQHESQSRRSSHRDSTRVQSPLFPSGGGKNRFENEQQASLLERILKNQRNREGTSDNILDNSFNENDGSQILMEEFAGDEINSNNSSLPLSYNLNALSIAKRFFIWTSSSVISCFISRT